MRYVLAFVICIFGLVGCKEKHGGVSSGFEPGDEVLKIAGKDGPESLDPRKVSDLPSVTYLHMLYEGLLRIDFRGEPAPGIAQEWSVSPDQKTYTFHLRESKWSNGEPLTAEDFVRTWQTVLTPNFASPNAYQFYLIKGARAAKTGTLPVDQVGIKAIDPLTIEIELEEPAPFFPELLATHFFYPVPKEYDLKDPISNGPFQFYHHRPNYELAVKKNPHYWDAGEVHLDGIVVAVCDNHTALRLYENKELDWAGSPLGTIPQEAILPLRRKHQLLATPGAGIHWIRVNTMEAPIKNKEFRKALAMAIDRKQLVDHVLQGNQKGATGIIPAAMSKKTAPFFKDGDIPAAWEAFQKALAQMDISKDDIPELTLIYPGDDRSHKVAQALQQQWFKALGFTVKLNRLETKLFLEKVKTRAFQLATGSWFADYRDPINFLEIFKSKEVSTNATNWENEQFTDLLRSSATEKDPNERLALLNQAEGILIAEMPVIPLYFSTFNYVKDVTLLGVYFSDLGYLDFKNAFFSD